jgi:hypothetical protein
LALVPVTAAVELELGASPHIVFEKPTPPK